MRLTLALIAAIVIIITIYPGVQSAAVSGGTAGLRKVLDDMFQDYDKGIRPQYGEKATQVGVTVYILAIDSIDETNQDFTITFFFRQQWDDPRLAFRPQPFARGRAGTDPASGKILLDEGRANKIWRPDTFFANEKTSHLHHVTGRNEDFKIRSNGTVATSARWTVKAGCPMNLHYFPFDTQLCTIEIESFGASTEDVIYYWAQGEDSFGIAPSVSYPGAFIVGHRLQAFEITIATGNYSRLSMSLQFRRISGFYVLKSYIPTAIIVIVSLLTLLFANPLLEPLIHVITIYFLIWYNVDSWMRKLPHLTYFTSLTIYFYICIGHLLISLFVSLAGAYRHLKKGNRHDGSYDGICHICKPLTEIDNYRSGNSRRGSQHQSSERMCSPEAVLLFSIKLAIVGLFVASNVAYWIFYKSLTNAVNQRISTE